MTLAYIQVGGGACRVPSVSAATLALKCLHFIRSLPTYQYLELAGAAVLYERRERCQLQLGVRLQHVTDQIGHLGDIVTESLAHADPDRVTGHFLHFFAESLHSAERSEKPKQEQ